jgi:hypothetical protein
MELMKKNKINLQSKKKSETFRLITGQNHGHGELPSVHSFTPMITRSSQDIFRIIASAIQKMKYAETTLNTCTARILNSSEFPGRPKVPSPPREKREQEQDYSVRTPPSETSADTRIKMEDTPILHAWIST